MLIGLTGDSRSGKDSVAGILVTEFGYEQRNLATPIRKMLLDINPYLEDGCNLLYAYEQAAGDWDYIKLHYPDSVDLMIGLGQAARDHIGEDVWLTATMKNLPEKLVIADVRQPNEYRKIKELGGQIWHIRRPGTTRRGMDGLLDGYRFDATIDNIGTLSDLKGIVSAAVSSQIHASYIQKNDFLDHPLNIQGTLF